MANHKRRRPKHQRAGCSYKPWKDERVKRRNGTAPIPVRRVIAKEPANVELDDYALDAAMDWEQDEDRRYRDVPDTLPPGVTLDLVG